MTVKSVADRDEARRGWDWRTVGLVGGIAVAMLAIPVSVGVLKGHADKTGGEFSPTLAVALALALLGVVGLLAWALSRRHPLPIGEGERASAIKRRRFWGILGTMFATGFLVGIGSITLQSGDPSQWLNGTLPPWFALLAAGLTTVALIFGTIAFFRQIDELERADNLYAAAMATNALTIVYPLWYLLWKGGFVREPQHTVLFGILFIVMMAVYGWRKLR